MKLKLDSKSKSLPQASKLKKKHGEKKSHVNESSKSQAENQNSTELHLEQEALTLDEAPLQQLLDSAPPLDYSEDHVSAGDNHGNFENDQDQENENDNPVPDQVDEESDSSEDEVAPRNTIGDVPLEWYRDEKHIGYDISGRKY